MCVLFLYYYPDGSRPYKLIIASNRDEFYDKPTIPAQFWSATASHLIAGGWGFVRYMYMYNTVGYFLRDKTTYPQKLISAMYAIFAMICKPQNFKFLPQIF